MEPMMQPLFRHGARVLSVIGLTVIAGTALAQEPLGCPPMVPEDQTLQEGPSCSMSQGTPSASIFTLSEAEALGAGIVLQDITQNFGCGINRLVVVADCGSGGIAVFAAPAAPSQNDVIEETPGPGADPAQVAAFDAILTDLRAAAAAGTPIALTALVERAGTAGLEDVGAAPLGVRLTYNGWTVPTDCGCALHYPEMVQ
jgi:hypothetical protein